MTPGRPVAVGLVLAAAGSLQIGAAFAVENSARRSASIDATSASTPPCASPTATSSSVRPRTMPMTESNGLSMPVRPVPGHDESCSCPGCTRSLMPSQPPTLFSARIVSGNSAATIPFS